MTYGGRFVQIPTVSLTPYGKDWMFTALSKSYAPFGNGTLELETPVKAMTHKTAKMRDEEYAKNDDEDAEMKDEF